MAVCARAVVLTASISTLPTGTRAIVKLPVASVVAPNCALSVRLVTRTAVNASGAPDSSSVRPRTVPRPMKTMSTFNRCAARVTCSRTVRGRSVSGSKAISFTASGPTGT